MFSILYNEHLHFGHLAALTALSPSIFVDSWLKKKRLQLQLVPLVAAHLQFDQVMLAIECLHTGCSFPAAPCRQRTRIPALSIQSCNRHDLADVSKQLLKIAKTLRGTKQLEVFFFNDLSSYSQTLFITFLNSFLRLYELVTNP